MQIESVDIIRLIAQFLQEAKLESTLNALSNETGLNLRTMESTNLLQKSINAGDWTIVLEELQNTIIPLKYECMLYEQIILELTLAGETSAARSLLRKSDPLKYLKKNDPDRYLVLEQVIHGWNEELAYPNTSQSERRLIIAQEIIAQVYVAEKSRLMKMLSQAIKWQASQKIIDTDRPHDLYIGASKADIEEYDDQAAVFNYNAIKFPKEQHVEVATFVKNSIITGTADGFIEIWNAMTGKLDTSYAYQAKDDIMMMDSAVLCLATFENLVASGSIQGRIQVWDTTTGRSIVSFKTAHTEGVTALYFYAKGKSLLSSSYDFTVKSHGLNSKQTLKEFRSHTSFVNDVLYMADRVVSASSDGSVKIWNSQTAACLYTIKVHKGEHAASMSPTVHKIAALDGDRILVCNASSFLHIVSLNGELLRAINFPQINVDFTSIAFSPRQRFVYVVGEDRKIYCIELGDSVDQLIDSLLVSEKSLVVGISGSKNLNCIAAYCEDGVLSLFKPKTAN